MLWLTYPPNLKSALSRYGDMKGITRSTAVAEGPRDAGVPVEILAAVERLYYRAYA